MILRVDKHEYDGDKVPVLIHWKNQKTKQTFVNEIIAINNFNRFTKIKGFSNVKVESGIFKESSIVYIKFLSREEKSAFLRHLYELGDDCNMYVACPEDIPFCVITKWVNASLPEMGIKADTIVEITD